MDSGWVKSWRIVGTWTGHWGLFNWHLSRGSSEVRKEAKWMLGKENVRQGKWQTQVQISWLEASLTWVSFLLITPWKVFGPHKKIKRELEVSFSHFRAPSSYLLQHLYHSNTDDALWFFFFSRHMVSVFLTCCIITGEQLLNQSIWACVDLFLLLTT